MQNSESPLPYIMYVHSGNEACEFSKDLVQFYRLLGTIHMQEIGDLIQQNIDIPPWLVGVPMLVNAETGEYVKGGEVPLNIRRLSANVNASVNIEENSIQPEQNVPPPITVMTASDGNNNKGKDDGEYDINKQDVNSSVDCNDAFAPLIDEDDNDDDTDDNYAKVNMEDINKMLAQRGIPSSN